MCSNPITITRTYPFGTRSYTVPCGKCADCVSKKRSGIAALSQLQANASGSVSFFTFTYSNDTVPVAISEDSADGPKVVGFERGADSPFFGKQNKSFGDSAFHNFISTDLQGVHRVCSLCREDVKLVLKQFRRYWQRNNPDDPLQFSYLIFGEYGEQRGRPHYHGLFYGLTPKQVDFLSSLWQKRFGFTCVMPTPGKVVSVTDIAKISNYVSKYIGKGVHSRWHFLMPYVEQPRRQSSIHFGLTDDETVQKLMDFMLAAIYSNQFLENYPDCLSLILSLWSLIGERVYLLMGSAMRSLHNSLKR